VVNLILSDVLGNPLSVIASGPTVPPEHIVTDLPGVLRQMGVWDELPGRVRSLLVAPETIPQRFDNVLQSVVLADVAALVRAAAAACRRRGLPAVTCGARFTGEAREFGRFWATLARSVREEHQPWAPPVAIVAGGELTVTVRGSGRGGRNTEMALAAALALDGSQGITVASLASDGDDGRSGAAGAVVDTVTVAVLRDRGIDPLRALYENDSATALAAADALVVTGLTGTNVNDLYLVIIE
jgi:glycerate-2-kinase